MECQLNYQLKEKECCICMETLQPDKNIAITQCGHTFCLKCLLIHCKEKNSCPLCRMTLISKSDLNPNPNPNPNSNPTPDLEINISESFPDLLPIPSPMRSPFRIVSNLFQHGPYPSPETSPSSSPSSQLTSQLTSSIPDLIPLFEQDIESDLSDASEDIQMTPPRIQRVRRIPATPRRPRILRIHTRVPSAYPPSIIRNPVRCSNCNAMGHNRRTCPLRTHTSTSNHNQYC